MVNQKILLVVGFIVGLGVGHAAPARADEPELYLKFTCIPEIGYMELTSTVSYDELSVEDRRKAGLFAGGKRFCELADGTFTELKTDESGGYPSKEERPECVRFRRLKANPTCEFPNKGIIKGSIIELDLEVGGSGKSPCAGVSWFDITVKMNGIAVKTLKQFGKQCTVHSRLKEDGTYGEIGPVYAPDILAYQSFGGNFFYACTGRENRRSCENFQVNLEKFKERENAGESKESKGSR